MGKEQREAIPRFGTVNFERRKHPRFSVDLPVEYWKICDNSKRRPGRSSDISEGGLLLYVSDQVEIGQNLRVKLFFDSGLELKTIEAKVEVVWKDFRLEEKSDYRIGVKFVEISPEDMENLRSFLINLLKVKNQTELNIPPRLLSNLGISTFGDFAYLPSERPDEDESH
jgi:c-di-GMP-binding flagellar brake protein YcgR